MQYQNMPLLNNPNTQKPIILHPAKTQMGHGKTTIGQRGLPQLAVQTDVCQSTWILWTFQQQRCGRGKKRGHTSSIERRAPESTQLN